jgi:hypothetical protein
MWEKEEFIVANGFTQFNNPNVARDLSPYDFFDGEVGFGGANDIEFSDARGRRRRRKKPMKSRAKEGVKRREKRRADRMNLKSQEIEAQKQIAEKSLKAQEKDATLLSSLGLSDNKNLPEVSPNKTKSNTIYWVVGGLAVATILGVVLYKKYKK